MAYRVGEVVYTNFGPFRNVCVDFSAPGLTVVEGEIDREGFESNGSGKSMLIEGVAWAIYDQCLRASYGGDKVVRLGSGKEGASVRVSLHDPATNRTLEMLRYRKHPQHGNKFFLRVNGDDVTRGTTTDTDALVLAELRVDFVSFCNSVAFAAREDVASFFAATDTDRKSVLEKIVGIEQYTNAAAAAAVDVRKMEGELEEWVEALRGEEAKAAAAQTYYNGIKEQFDRKAMTERLAKATAELAAARRAEQDLMQKATLLRQRVALEEEAYAELRAAYDTELTAYRVWAREMSDKLTGARAAQSKAEARLEDVKKNAARTEKLKIGSCPTCDQAVTAKSKADSVRKLKASAEELGAASDAAQMEVTGYVTEYNARPEPEAPDNANLLLLQQSSKDANRALSGAVAVCSRCGEQREELKTQLDAGDGRLSKARAVWDKAVQAWEVSNAKLPKLERKLAESRFWKDGFGNRGIKSFLIESKLPVLNARATWYAQRLLGSGAYVRLHATTQLTSRTGTQEKLSVEGFIPGCAASYSSASRGQKNRLNLCLLLAMRELACAGGTGLDQLFVDELFDGLDASGVDRALELLREAAMQRPVLLVTHDERLKSAGDHLWTVKHNGSTKTPEATVICAGGVG